MRISFPLSQVGCRALLLLSLMRPAGQLLAQDGQASNPQLIEALAPLLQAEDQRRFDSTLFARSLLHQETRVRHAALFAIAHIGDRRGTALILPVLLDRDPSVVADAFFALGLLADTSAVDAIVARLERPDSIMSDGVTEAASALARIGGARAAQVFSDIVSGRSRVPDKRLLPFRTQGLLEAWRFGRLAPVSVMQGFVKDADAGLRYGAVYSLGRLRTPAAGQAILDAVRDKHPLVQEVAVRALTKSYADSAGLAAATVTGELVRMLPEAKTGLRINALQALATWHDPALASKVTPLLVDPVLNVQVQAATTLGELGGGTAAKALDNLFGRKDASWALKRAALLGLAVSDPALFGKRAAVWARGTALGSKTPDAREQVAALDGWGIVAPADGAVFQSALADPKPEVVAAALAAWHRARPTGDPLLLAAARERLKHASVLVRVAAIDVVAGGATLDDLDPLLTAWQLGTTQKTLDDRMAVLGVIDSMVRRFPETRQRLEDPARQSFFNRPIDPVAMPLRREAERRWPLLAQRWGPAFPMDQSETGRSLDDYRGIVRTFMLAEENTHLLVDLGLGAGKELDIELFGAESPLTVANFIRLVRQNYFDQNRWHRVVPNFVVQSGDPTGTGDGGPAWVIRAEVNRRHYDNTVVGMADSGLDTGGSQWFINLSAQPHLDGRYTVFGRIVSGGLNQGFSRIVQGDLIRSIRIAPSTN